MPFLVAMVLLARATEHTLFQTHLDNHANLSQFATSLNLLSKDRLLTSHMRQAPTHNIRTHRVIKMYDKHASAPATLKVGRRAIQANERDIVAACLLQSRNRGHFRHPKDDPKSNRSLNVVWYFSLETLAPKAATLQPFVRVLTSEPTRSMLSRGLKSFCEIVLLVRYYE